jgi:hypothetical protein
VREQIGVGQERGEGAAADPVAFCQNSRPRRGPNAPLKGVTIGAHLTAAWPRQTFPRRLTSGLSAPYMRTISNFLGISGCRKF